MDTAKEAADFAIALLDDVGYQDALHFLDDKLMDCLDDREAEAVAVLLAAVEREHAARMH